MALLDDVQQAMVLTARIRNELDEAGDEENLILALDANAALTDLFQALGGLS